MIAHHQQKRLFASEIASTKNRVAVSERRRLLDTMNGAGMPRSRCLVGGTVARMHHHADVFDPGLENLFHNDRKGAFLLAIAIDE